MTTIDPTTLARAISPFGIVVTVHLNGRHHRKQEGIKLLSSQIGLPAYTLKSFPFFSRAPTSHTEWVLNFFIIEILHTLQPVHFFFYYHVGEGALMRSHLRAPRVT